MLLKKKKENKREKKTKEENKIDLQNLKKGLLQKSLKIKEVQKFEAIHHRVGETILGLLDAKLSTTWLPT